MKKLIVLFVCTIISFSAYNQDFVNGDFSDSLNGWTIGVVHIYPMAPGWFWWEGAIYNSTESTVLSINKHYFFRQTVKSLNIIGEYDIEYDLTRSRDTLLFDVNDTIDVTSAFVVINNDTLDLNIYDSIVNGDSIHIIHHVSNTDSIQLSIYIIKKLHVDFPSNDNRYIPSMTFDNFKLTQTNVGIKPINHYPYFNVYPNPSNGEFSILFETNSEDFKRISIYSEIGKTVYSNYFTGNKFTFTKSDLPKGIYLVVVENEHGRYMKKLVVY